MRRKVSGIALIFIAFFILLSCEQKQDTLGNPESKNEDESKTGQAMVKNNFRLNPTEETHDTYQWYCAQCHGITGEGTGINSPRMPVKPINHRDPAIMSKKSDQDLFAAITEGGLAIERAPCMPQFKQTLDKKTIASLVGYLRELCKCEYSKATSSTPSIRIL